MLNARIARGAVRNRRSPVPNAWKPPSTTISTAYFTMTLVSPLFIAATFAQADRSPVNVKDIVEIERLTHTEVSEKIQKEGKTSVLIITGGTEERGPHAVLGGHTIMSRHRGVEIAKRLGNALLAPVLPSWSPAAAVRAARATVVMPALFVLADKVIGNLQMALFAAFGWFPPPLMHA